MNDVVGRLQQISERIAEIQRRAELPPSLRGRGVDQTPAAQGSQSSGPAAGTQGADALNAAQVSQFQSLLNQALSLGDVGTGAATSPLDTINTLVGSGTSGSVNGASSAQLEQYQQMLLDTIRRSTETDSTEP